MDNQKSKIKNQKFTYYRPVIQRVLLGLLAFCLPLSIAASNVAWGLCALFFLVCLLVDPSSRRYRWTGLEMVWLVYFSVTVLTSLLSSDPGLSVKKLKAECLVIIFVLASQWQSREDVERNVRVFLFSIVAAALAGICQGLFGLSLNSAEETLSVPQWAGFLPECVLNTLASWNGRAIGFFNHPLTYAEVLILGLPILLAGILSYGGRLRLCWGIGALLVLGGIIASQTRGVWLSVMGMLVIWTFCKRQKSLIMVFGGVVLLGLLALAVSPSLQNRFSSIYDVKSDNSNMIRLGLWDKSVKMIKEKPVLGVGIGHIHIPGKDLKWKGDPRNLDWTEVHNIFLQMAVERGFVGLLAFLALLFVMGRIFWQAGQKGGWAEGLFFGFVGLVLAGFTESWTHDSEVMMSLFFLLGCASSLNKRLSE